MIIEFVEIKGTGGEGRRRGSVARKLETRFKFHEHYTPLIERRVASASRAFFSNSQRYADSFVVNKGCETPYSVGALIRAALNVLNSGQLLRSVPLPAQSGR